MVVYVVANKKTRKTKVGFTDDLKTLLKQLQQQDKAWNLIQKETYTSKKNALIRVKQLKNKLR
jgi:predicted GIY-YIG superfamily endonuclease